MTPPYTPSHSLALSAFNSSPSSSTHTTPAPFTPPPCSIASSSRLLEPLAVPPFGDEWSDTETSEAATPSRIRIRQRQRENRVLESENSRHRRSSIEPVAQRPRTRRSSAEPETVFSVESERERSTLQRPADSGRHGERPLSSMAWCRSREAEAEVPAMANMSPTSLPDVHDSPRGRFMNAFGLGLPKSMAREEDAEHEQIPCMSPAISIIVPESLPTCRLKTAFQCTENNLEIPPAFYPGQAIPTVLTFELDRYSCLRHSLNPILTMSLVGSLTIPDSAPRTIICVSVSLSEGMALWARDAAQAYAGRAPGPGVPDVSLGLPGGTYSLPLTVQVPTTPRLPPTFDIDGATFSVTYSLNVNLTCDDPQTGSRVVLSESGKAFEMLPETLPTRAPRFAPQSFWVRMGHGYSLTNVANRQPNHRWSVRPMLPTTTFSPTSMIPLELEIAPPKDAPDSEFQIAIRVALRRREHTSYGFGPVDPNVNDQMVKDEEVVVKWGWIEADGHSTVRIPEIILPLMLGQEWKYGASTMLNVGSARSQYGQNHVTDHAGISVASTFHLCITLAFAQHSLRDILPAEAGANMPPPGVFGPATSSEACTLSLTELKRTFPGTVRTLPIPIVIGSVAEPRDAMHISRWSDLHLERRQGRERGRMIHGEALTYEDGWVCPPPAYADALGVVPYHYG